MLLTSLPAERWLFCWEPEVIFRKSQTCREAGRKTKGFRKRLYKISMITDLKLIQKEER